MQKPVRATNSCKHYSYVVGEGSKCSKHICLSKIDHINTCLFSPTLPCGHREDFTDEDRELWKKWVTVQLKRFDVMTATIGPVAANERKSAKCRYCDGQFHIQRVRNSAWVWCDGDECVSKTHVNTGMLKYWPVKE